MLSVRKITGLVIMATGLHGLAIAGEPVSGDTKVRIDKLVKKVTSTMVSMPGGAFDMGDWGKVDIGMYYDLDTYSRPLHKVTLDSFSIMAYKVTFDDFDVFTDATGNERIDMDPLYRHEPDPRRAAGVSWYGARAYCQWLGKLTGQPFDLPTEAQWEYAARSGGKRVLYGTDNGKIERPRNFPRDWEHGEPEPLLPDVGSFPPNPAGIYGMTENTQEWVMDWFDEDYYKVSPAVNPTGPSLGIKKVQRGSVDGKAEISAAVFMRRASELERVHFTYLNGFGREEVMVPFPGYSAYPSDNFRCVSNKYATPTQVDE